MADVRKPAAAAPKGDDAKSKPPARAEETVAPKQKEEVNRSSASSGKGPKASSSLDGDGDKAVSDKPEKEKERIVKERDMLRYKMIMEEEKVDGNLDDEVSNSLQIVLNHDAEV